MNIYTIKEAKVLGEPDETYGITYWATVEETDQPVMFNSRRSDPLEGLQLVAEESDQKRTKAKNTPYLRLKKVKISEGVNSGQMVTTSPISSNPSPGNQLESLVRAMDGKVTLILKAINRLEKQDKVADDDGSDVTLDDLPDV